MTGYPGGDRNEEIVVSSSNAWAIVEEQRDTALRMRNGRCSDRMCEQCAPNEDPRVEAALAVWDRVTDRSRSVLISDRIRELFAAADAVDPLRTPTAPVSLDAVLAAFDGWDAEVEKLRAENVRLLRQIDDQERFNVQSRRSLCEQSDRYKAERDAAVAERARLRAEVVRLRSVVGLDHCPDCFGSCSGHYYGEESSDV